MDIKFMLAVLVAFLGAATLNIGKGVQKMKVKVFAQKMGIFRKPYRRDFLIWLAGMGMTAAFGPCQWVALQLVDNPSLTSSMMGLGLVALVLFAIKVIGEKLVTREIVGIAVIISSTFFLVYFQEQREDPTDYNGKALLIGAAALIAFNVTLVTISRITKKLHGFAFGALAGACNGFPLVLVKIAVISGGSGEFIQQLRGPFIYMAIFIGIFATVFTNIGFWKDRALIVVPTYTSFSIMVPAVFEYLAFGFGLQPIQYGALGIMLSGVVVLCTGAPEAVLAGDFRAAPQEE